MPLVLHHIFGVSMSMSPLPFAFVDLGVPAKWSQILSDLASLSRRSGQCDSSLCSRVVAVHMSVSKWKPCRSKRKSEPGQTHSTATYHNTIDKHHTGVQISIHTHGRLGNDRGASSSFIAVPGSYAVELRHKSKRTHRIKSYRVDEIRCDEVVTTRMFTLRCMAINLCMDVCFRSCIIGLSQGRGREEVAPVGNFLKPQMSGVTSSTIGNGTNRYGTVIQRDQRIEHIVRAKIIKVSSLFPYNLPSRCIPPFLRIFVPRLRTVV